jgi:hypothetical protein
MKKNRRKSVIVIILVVLLLILVVVIAVFAGAAGRQKRNSATLPDQNGDSASANPDENSFDNDKSRERDDEIPLDRDMILLDAAARAELVEQEKAQNSRKDKEQKTPNNQESVEKGYRIINTAKDRTAALLSVPGISEYKASDYEIGKLLESGTRYSRAFEAIQTLLSGMNSGSYPEDLFDTSTAFYLTEKLKIELEHGIIPNKVHIGWPLVDNKNQVNIPVKFMNNQKFTTGEIIFNKQAENWYIMEIAVDFSLLTEDQPQKTYDEYFYYE